MALSMVGCQTGTQADTPVATNAPAEDFSYSYDAEKGGMVITGYKGKDSVKVIAEAAFLEYGNLVAIELPEELTTIGGTAFQRCALERINIPKTLVSVG